ncbi:MAG: hypothetical protein CSA72_10445 [Rhodobacterales bacterium]|nr:MAG: hypothetical protein CSA72_10445 [Rhodobacterales bacterium]
METEHANQFTDLPGDFDDIVRRARVRADAFTHVMISALIDEGLTEDQAGSVAAHCLLDEAYGVAFIGALLGGRTPDPEKFLDAARGAVARLDDKKTVAEFERLKAEGEVEQ